MSDVFRKFDARVEEIELYLSFLASVQDAVSGNANSGKFQVAFAFTPKHQQVLHASVFLHLYNLVESTVTWCIELVESAVSSHESRTIGHLSERLRTEWVKTVARTSEDLTHGHRLDAALLLCNQVLNLMPPELKIARKVGGNWDDEKIFGLASRIGFNLNISPAVQRRVRRPIRNDLGPMKIVKKMRNELAHGSISFSECGADHSVTDLREIANDCLSYLREFIGCVESYVSNHEYLEPGARPPQGAAV
jgi:hypothetical protein